MTLSITFLTLSFAVVSAPGPSSMFVMVQGSTGRMSRVFAALCGLALANMLWLSFTVLGISSLISSSHTMLEAIRVCGVIYLTYLGIKLIKSKGSKSSTVEFKSRALVAVQAFITSITNPKAALFYAAFLPQFIDGHENVSAELFKLGLVYISIAMVVFFAYGLFSTFLSKRVRHISYWLNKIIGVSFIAAAASLFKWKSA